MLTTKQLVESQRPVAVSQNADAAPEVFAGTLVWVTRCTTAFPGYIAGLR